MNDNQGLDNNSDSDNSNNISSDSESSEEEPDEEGDKLVDSITDTSIIKYKTIKNKKWVIANYKNSQDDDENDSDEVSIASVDEEKDVVQNNDQQYANETNVEEIVNQLDDQNDDSKLIDIELYPCDGTTDESSDEGSEEAGYGNLCTQSSDDLYDQYENRYQDDFQTSHVNAYHDYYPGGACSYMA